MIGGGPGSFIGAVHRIAARMDGDYELVAGAFSSKPEKCLETARELGIAEERAYPSWAEMLESESALPADERVQVIMITTPNHVHAAPTIAALEGGFHVILDKPLCTSMEEARAMEAAAKSSKALFCLTHTYTGYPMIKEAKHQIACWGVGCSEKDLCRISARLVIHLSRGREPYASGMADGPDEIGESWRHGRYRDARF